MDETTEQGEARKARGTITGAKGDYKRAFTQRQVSYRPYPNSFEARCGNCVFYRPTSDWNPCWIVENGHDEDPVNPYQIASDGWCERYEARPAPEREAPMTLRIEGLDETGALVAETAQRKPADDPGLIERVGQAIKALFQSEPDFEPSPVGGFKVVTGAGGEQRWLAWWTNNFEDFHDELFTDKAIANYTALAASGKIPLPHLWWEHTPGTKHGECDHVFKIGHFGMATGTFDDPADNPLVEPLLQEYERLGDKAEVSHGYFYPPARKQDGMYHEFYTFEISPLRPQRAANPYTKFMSDMEIKAMEITPQKKDDLTRLFGDDLASQIIEQAQQQGDLLEKQGTRFKGLDGTGTGEQPGQGEKGDAPPNADQTPPSDTKDQPDPEVVTGLKSELDTMKTAHAELGQKVDQLQTDMNNLVEAIKHLLNTDTRGSKSERTEVPDDHPQWEFLREKNKGAEDDQSVFDLVFGGLNRNA